MDDHSLINEVRFKNDIVEVISSYLPLTKKGKNYFGVCPFHADTNPSMSVSREKQIYKCFSCGASGNVFNFVMDYEQVDFKEALNILAKRVGLTVGNFKPTKEKKYEKYYKMYDLAVKFYQNNLNSEEGVKAKEYLASRKIDEELIKRFKIGLSLREKDTLTKILLKKDYTLKDLEDYGLGNGHNDLYINRIMFPLFDNNGDPVGFSGRIYNGSHDSKYINTKETNIFKKGELLYNYHEAKEAAREKKYLIVVEGFMDVIRLASVGIDNVVALMGTALTKEQITLLKRLSNNIYLCLDGDKAGQKGIYQNGLLLEQENVNLCAIILKDDLDPDEYILKYGQASFTNLLENPTSFSEFKVDYLKGDYNFASIDDKSKYINQVLASLSNVNDDIKKELILEKLAKDLEINIEILRKKLQNDQKYSKIKTLKKTPVQSTKKDKYQKATLVILNYLLEESKFRSIYERKLNYLPYPLARQLANEIIYYAKQNAGLVLADFITYLSDKEEVSNYLKEVIGYEVVGEKDEASFEDYLNVIKSYNQLCLIKKLKEEMQKEVDPLRKAKIADKILEVKSGK